MSPATSERTDHLTLFNRPSFASLAPAAGAPWRHDHVEGGRLVGTLTGVLDGDRLASGLRAPYGGPDVVRDREAVASIEALVDGALARAAADGASRVRVRLRPGCHGDAEPWIQHAFLRRGFHVARHDVSYGIDLRPWADAEAYVDALRSPARRALGHLLRDDALVLEDVDDDDAFLEGWRVLERNRAEKARALAFDLDYALRLRAAFPGEVRMLVLRHGAVACAAALVYRVRPRHEHVQYWGDYGHDLPRSPMNLLAFRVVEAAIAAGCVHLELGPCIDGDGIGQGMVQFKRSILARPDLRLELEGRIG